MDLGTVIIFKWSHLVMEVVQKLLIVLAWRTAISGYRVHPSFQYMADSHINNPVLCFVAVLFTHKEIFWCYFMFVRCQPCGLIQTNNLSEYLTAVSDELQNAVKETGLFQFKAISWCLPGEIEVKHWKFRGKTGDVPVQVGSKNLRIGWMSQLTLILLTWRIGWAHNNARK